MTVRPWPRAAAALAVLAGFAAAAAAQNRLNLNPDESNRWSELRNGAKPRVREDNKDEAKKNEDAIRRKAQVEVARLLDYAATADGSSEKKAISDVVRGLNDLIVDPTKFSAQNKMTEGQRDIIKIFGAEMIAQLKPLIGTAEKPSTQNAIVKINATRMLSIVGKSGYEPVAVYAAEIINDPNQRDEVKVYALQALQHLFAVPHPELDNKSVFGNNTQAEEGPIKALIAFITRKPTYGPDASEEEVNAYRYLRREAIIALGKVRHAIFRDRQTAEIRALPGLVLLRVANSDVSLNPAPSLSERIEALAGYLNMQGDKEQNMDFAAGYIATALRDLVVEFKASRTPEKPKPDDKNPPQRAVEERDRQGWKVAAVRFEVGMKVWRDNYDNIPGARPAGVKKMMNDLASLLERSVFAFMSQGRRDDVILEPLNTWLSSTQFPSTSLVPGDPTATVTRPGSGR
jgi:hypothetical protein